MNSRICRTPGATLLLVFMLAGSSGPVFSAVPASVAVQENIDRLIKTNSCPGCDLTGADLNRLNLSGADLRNADLSEATFFLADLSDANLSGAVLRKTQFGGADLAKADLRGADLRGAFLSGAYTVGSLMDGTLVDRGLLDEDADVNLHEKIFIPDEEKTKPVPDKQEVSIAERRDFAPVPPVVPEKNLQEGDGVQGPSELAVEQEAPPVKSVAPVRHITISEPEDSPVVQQMAIEKKPADREDQTADVDESAMPVELAANKSVKVAMEEDYQELSDAKKTEMTEKLPSVDETASIKKSPEGPGKTVSAKEESPGVKTAQQNGERAAVSEEMQVVSEPVVESTEIQETDLLSDAETKKELEVETITDKNIASDRSEPVQVESAPELPLAFDSPPAQPSEGVNEMDLQKDQVVAETAEKMGALEAAVVEEAQAVSMVSAEDVTVLNFKKLLETGKCMGCNLAGVDLSGEKLDEADLERADLSGALLVDTDLSEANLKGVSFRKANLKDADLREADLYRADFGGADLTGADFKGAQLDDANFSGAIGYNTEIMTE